MANKGRKQTPAQRMIKWRNWMKAYDALGADMLEFPKGLNLPVQKGGEKNPLLQYLRSVKIWG